MRYVIYMADSLLPLFPLLPLLPLFPLVHLLGILLAVTGSVYLVPRLLVNWPLVPLFSPCSSQPKIPTPRGFPDPNMYLIRTTLWTQPKCSLTGSPSLDGSLIGSLTQDRSMKNSSLDTDTDWLSTWSMVGSSSQSGLWLVLLHNLVSGWFFLTIWSLVGSSSQSGLCAVIYMTLTLISYTN
jgi:hypothetical protein